MGYMIRLFRKYRGHLTNNQWMESGEYDLDKNFAEYLVENGHAEYLVTEVTPVSDDDSNEQETPKQESPSRNRRNRK